MEQSDKDYTMQFSFTVEVTELESMLTELTNLKVLSDANADEGKSSGFSDAIIICKKHLDILKGTAYGMNFDVALTEAMDETEGYICPYNKIKNYLDAGFLIKRK